MEHYIELILKKKKYIHELTKEKEAIDKELTGILEEQKTVSDKNISNYEKLGYHEHYEREYTVNAAVLAIGALLLVISLAGLPFFAFLDINMLIAVLGILGFNLVNLGVCFGIVGITKKYYQSKRNKHLDEITLLNEQIQLVNEQVQEIRKRYDEVYNKSKSIALQIIKEEKDIEKIKQVIVNALLKASNKDLEVLNPILDNLIEKEISSSEQLVIDTDINRNRSLD